MKSLFLLTVIFCISFTVNAQNVGIGTTQPDASAKLDVTSTDKGMLVPRMTQAQRDAISAPATGLLIYQTDNTPGFYFYNGSGWTAIAGNSSGWGLTGNAGTNPATNFIGTTDNQPLLFRVNNLRAGYLGTRNNIFWGRGSGSSNATGNYNVGIGTGVLNKNSEGAFLVAIGDSALFNNTVDGNVAIGYKSLLSNTLGRSNTATGTSTLFKNTIGWYNTANGNSALYNNTTGSSNTAIGNLALQGNISGSENTAIGNEALFSNTEGGNNAAFGNRALHENTTGSHNVGIGTAALFNNTDKSGLVAIGDSALYFNLGENNTATGFSALRSNTTGTVNTANGNSALYHNIDGHHNTAVGAGTLYNNINGNHNSAIGSGALLNNSSGAENTAVGDAALFQNTKGNNNTAIGEGALFNNTEGNNNTALGKNADVAAEGFENATAIGSLALAGASNSMVLGSITGVNGATADVNVGIGTTTPRHALEINATSGGGRVQLFLFEKTTDYARLKFGNASTTNYWDVAGFSSNTTANSRFNFFQSGVGDVLSLHGDGNAVLMGTLTQNSDKTLKTHILPVANILPSLLALNGYRYQWKNENMDQSIQIGLLAQEVQEYFPELVKKDEKGILSLNYSGLIPLVIEAVKEQNKVIQKQQSFTDYQRQKIKDLENENKRIRKQIENILEKLEK